MEDYLESNSKIVEVGSFIKQFIKHIETKQVDFAKYLRLRPSNLSKILNGERRLTIEFALILERLSNIDVGLWLKIQNKNEIHRMRKSHSKHLNKFQLKELLG